MKLFIDTANVDEIRSISDYGFVEGVTTNPSLIAKQGQSMIDVIKEIVSIIDGPISAEVTSEVAEEMIEQGLALSKLHPNIVVKIPMTLEGLKAVKVLNKKNVKTNVTLVFNVSQALLAARSGATYVSPFIGRINDLGYNGVELIEDIAEIFDYYGIQTEIIAASIRTVNDLINAAKAGSTIATVPYQVLIASTKHLLTDKGLDIFNQDIAKMAK